MTLINKLSGILSAVIIVSGSTAFAVNHDETFPKMQEMVLSASPEELEGIMNNYCKNMFAATMTATDIRGRAAELAKSDEMTETQIFTLSGNVAVEFSTIYANICK